MENGFLTKVNTVTVSQQEQGVRETAQCAEDLCDCQYFASRYA
jgi:hypothetical protein